MLKVFLFVVAGLSTVSAVISQIKITQGLFLSFLDSTTRKNIHNNLHKGKLSLLHNHNLKIHLIKLYMSL
jgi:hypothetical protein